MAITKQKYDGKDPQPWKVLYAAKPVTKVKTETFDSYTAANVAARRYTLETGLPAGAVRA